jgi:hypothetical protein
MLAPSRRRQVSATLPTDPRKGQNPGGRDAGMNISAVIERVQQIGDLLEKLIKQSNELRDRVIRLEENTEETSDRVAVLETKLDRQTALVERLAETEGVDPASVYADHDLDGPVEEVAGVADDADDTTTTTTTATDGAGDGERESTDGAGDGDT